MDFKERAKKLTEGVRPHALGMIYARYIESFGRECYTSGLRRGAEIAKNNECDDNCLCAEAILAESEKEGKV